MMQQPLFNSDARVRVNAPVASSINAEVLPNVNGQLAHNSTVLIHANLTDTATNALRLLETGTACAWRFLKTPIVGFAYMMFIHKFFQSTRDIWIELRELFIEQRYSILVPLLVTFIVIAFGIFALTRQWKKYAVFRVISSFVGGQRYTICPLLIHRVTFEALRNADKFQLPDHEQHLKIGIPYAGSIAALSIEVYNFQIESGSVTISVSNHGLPVIAWDTWPERSTLPTLTLDANIGRIQKHFGIHEYPFERGASLLLHATSSKNLRPITAGGGINVTLWGRIETV